MMRVAVIGAGWAGLAAAVRATQAGHAVSVFEAAGLPGGRARSDDTGDGATDNGQHILLGGYARTLALMRDVGVDVERALLRLPLSMTYPDGSGFALSPGGPRPPRLVRNDACSPCTHLRLECAARTCQPRLIGARQARR